MPLAGSSLLVLSVTNVDKIVIGARTDEIALGLYLMAFNQSSLPLQVFSEAARRVSLAGFSRLTDDPDRLERSLARGVALLMMASVPVCAVLACYAAPMLSAVYGPQWTPAATALQMLAVLGLVRIVLFIGYDLLVALDGNRVLLGLQGLWLVVMLPAVVIGTELDGIRGASIAQVLVAALVVLPAFAVVLHRRRVRLWSTVLACARPALGAVLIVAAAFIVHATVSGPWPRLLVGWPWCPCSSTSRWCIRCGRCSPAVPSAPVLRERPYASPARRFGPGPPRPARPRSGSGPCTRRRLAPSSATSCPRCTGSRTPKSPASAPARRTLPSALVATVMPTYRRPELLVSGRRVGAGARPSTTT